MTIQRLPIPQPLKPFNADGLAWSLAETIAEIVTGSSFDASLHFHVARTRYEEGEGKRAGCEALSDFVRKTLTDAAGLIVAAEAAYPDIWIERDWRDTCDTFARQLEQHGIVTPQWARDILSRPSR